MESSLRSTGVSAQGKRWDHTHTHSICLSVCLSVCLSQLVCCDLTTRPTCTTPPQPLERTGRSRSTRRPSYCSRTATNTSAESSGTETSSEWSVNLFQTHTHSHSHTGSCTGHLQCRLCAFCRFRHGYCKGNPRKMVRTWAEKEMRNLLRWTSRTSVSPEAGKEDSSRGFYVTFGLWVLGCRQLGFPVQNLWCSEVMSSSWPSSARKTCKDSVLLVNLMANQCSASLHQRAN